MAETRQISARGAACAALIAAATLAGCAPAGGQPSTAEALNPKQMAQLDKELGGKVAGAPQNCIPGGPNYSTIRVSDSIVLYKVSNNLVYRNDLRNTCRGLARDTDVMVIQKYGSTQTCDGDFFHLVDGSSGIRGASCVFGEFVPYRKPKGDAS